MINTGIFDKLFGGQKLQQQIEKAVDGYFTTLTAYTPSFYTFKGGVYEMMQTRAAIHAFATHCSKLKPHVIGPKGAQLSRRMQLRMNPWEVTSQFLYRTATILDADNNCILVPVLNAFDETVGAYPIKPSMTQIVDVDGEPFLRFQFSTGQFAAVEFKRCGVLTKMQYEDDFFGSSNSALDPTLALISTQQQGLMEGIKNGASIRFLAILGNSVRPEDLKVEQKAFRETNLSGDNNGGVLIIDQKYKEVKQLDSKPFVPDAEQMRIIDENVEKYYGVNAKIMRNEWDEEEWNAFYEGKVEPFALQLSLVLTNMFFTEREQSFGNGIEFSANRLQFASMSSKITAVQELYDRGMLSRNEGREILQMAPVEGGDEFFIRGEYVSVADRQTAKLPPGNGQKGDGNNAE